MDNPDTRTMDPEILSQWIGRTEVRRDTIRLEPATFLELTLDRPPALRERDALPPLWHWLYFLNAARVSDLGRDGHPALGRFLPPVALPRRMWAGGRFGFNAPLLIGSMATRTSTITDVKLKKGRTGPLCFVTIRHEIADDNGPALWEEHDIVYREDPREGASAPQPPAADRAAPWTVTENVTVSEVVLFRYSALTFNGHRIHYDRDYARTIEGHCGLVVHGPLIATLLADLAVRRGTGKPLTGFEFRALSPVYDHAPFTIHAAAPSSELSLAARTAEGHLAMRAIARF